MVKPEQVLIIEPESELRFRGPFSEEPVTSHILLTNPTNRKVYYKIKTTAPKRYCVRPNSGMILPRKKSQIYVTLQPFDYDPTEKNKHKFMVQSLTAPVGDDDNNVHDAVWKDPIADQLMESKLKCVFESPLTTNMEELKVGTKPKIVEELETKLFKAVGEVNLLRVEDSSLRQENIQLKEDLLLLKKAALEDNGTLVTRGLKPRNYIQLPSNATVIAIVMGIIGYIFGKLF